MPEPKLGQASKKLKIKLEPEAPPKAGYGKRFLYIAVVFVIFIVILLISRQKEERIEPPPTTAPAPQPPAALETKISEKPAETPEKKNSPPDIVSVRLSPKVVYPGTKVKGEVDGYDKDNDEITFIYEWKKNGEIIHEAASDELDTAGFKKGELITLYVTPFDGKEKGKTRWSPTIMITNRPPEITSLPSVAVSNGKYLYEVKANDPDGDELAYSLENAPSGMTIDPATGVIKWDIPAVTDPKSVSTYNIRIIVSDGDATAFQGFSITPEVKIK